MSYRKATKMTLADEGRERVYEVIAEDDSGQLRVTVKATPIIAGGDWQYRSSNEPLCAIVTSLAKDEEFRKAYARGVHSMSCELPILLFEYVGERSGQSKWDLRSLEINQQTWIASEGWRICSIPAPVEDLKMIDPLPAKVRFLGKHKMKILYAGLVQYLFIYGASFRKALEKHNIPLDETQGVISFGANLLLLSLFVTVVIGVSVWGLRHFITRAKNKEELGESPVSYYPPRYESLLDRKLF